MTDRERCHFTVFHRDTYRYTGRGPNGFEMHYRRGQCKRWAVASYLTKDAGPMPLCRQHWTWLGLDTPTSPEEQP